MEEMGEAISRVQRRIRNLEMVEGQHQRELESTWAVHSDPYFMDGGVSARRTPEVFLDGAGRPAAVSGLGFEPDAVVLMGDADDVQLASFDRDGFSLMRSGTGELPGSLWQQFDASWPEAQQTHAAGFWPASIAWRCYRCRYPRNRVGDPRCEACDGARVNAKLIVEWAEPAGGWTDETTRSS